MRISKLEIQNFRGACDFSLEPDPGLNVLVGMNGAGKSSVLDAVAMLLSWLANRIKHRGGKGSPLSESDIRNNAGFATLRMEAIHTDHAFAWRLAKVKKGHDHKDVGSDLAGATQLAKVFRLEITKSEEQVNLPLFVYYPVNRAVLDIPLRIREKHRFELLSAYDEALTSGANFRTFFEWFREREDLENEARRDQQSPLKSASPSQFPDPQLEAVRTALSAFMPDFKNLTVRRNPLRMEVDKKEGRLTVNQLSDGEKCLMAMIGDLARRMAIANPLRKNPLEGDGVILIDEIDLHLHPQWQRMVIPNLIRVFPNCQFFISTHSPHVMTHVQPENLFLLTMKPEGIEVLRPKVNLAIAEV